MLSLLSYIYGILCILLIMSVSVVIGKGIAIIAGFNYNSLTTGFLLLTAIFYISAFPFMMAHGSLTVLTVLYVIEVCAVFAGAVYICRKNKVHANILCLRKCKDNLFLTAAVILGLFIMVLLVVLIHSDADDAFYLAQSSSALYSGRINPYEQSTGIPSFPDQTQYAFVGYEIWTAVICSIFNINTAVLYHSLLPVMFIIMHFLVMYDIGKALFKDRAAVFLMLIMVFDLMSGYSIYSQGAFVMLRLWQGKSVLVNVIMPFLMLVFIKILKQGYGNKYDKVMLYVILLSGMFISVVGVYLVPLEYAIFFIVFSIHRLICHKSIKELFLLTVPVIGILPFVAVYFYNFISDDTIKIATDKVEELSYAGILHDINGTGIILPVFVICMVFFALYKKKPEKYIFGLYPLVCICTIANPLICRYVAAYITGTPVYWRVFWLFQFNITICAAVIVIYDIVKKYKAVYIVCIVLTIILCGRPILTGQFFDKAHNFEKIDEITKGTVDAMADTEPRQVSLMMPEEYGYGVRQYSGRIIMIWSRYSYLYYQKEGSYDRLKEIYDSLYETRTVNKHIYNGLCDFNTDYVLLYKDTAIESSVEYALEPVYGYGDFVLYKIS